MTAVVRCQGCGNPLPPSTGNRPRKWCSERCRKAQYSTPCVDCGAPLNGSDGHGPNAAIRCKLCAARVAGEAKTRWTRQALLLAIRAWARQYGEPPATPDWNPTRAARLHDEGRICRFREGDWPHSESVVREFGSWNAGILAAGFEPRAPHGGAGNAARRRNQRVKT